MKLHIQLNDDTAKILLDEGLAGVAPDFADTIRKSRTKSGEVIKLVIHRHLLKLKPEPFTPDQIGTVVGDEA
jgi:hypothetical protein